MNRSGFPDLAAVDQLFSRRIFGEESDNLRNQQSDSGFLASPQHFQSGLPVQRQRFLTNNLLSGFGRLSHLSRMQISGSANINNIRFGQQLIQLLKNFCMVFLGERFGFRNGFRAETDNFCIRFRPPHGMGGTHRTGTDYSYFHSCSLSFRLFIGL